MPYCPAGLRKLKLVDVEGRERLWHVPAVRDLERTRSRRDWRELRQRIGGRIPVEVPAAQPALSGLAGRCSPASGDSLRASSFAVDGAGGRRTVS